MSTHKNIDRICAAAIVLALILSMVLLQGEALGITAAARIMGYEQRLFDTERVHTIDIVMDDWESFLETCENEEYAVCTVVIDGKSYRNVAIRAKGNTSLSTVSSMGSDRYSFKIEFDHYDSTNIYYGLDKLSLNNIIQDTTYMKDYLTYRMMGEFGVAAPLCSYADIRVNGEAWGLYLAVEGVEESFLQRNYGSNYGELYKPDSMDFGGGRGNGRDFDMDVFAERFDQFDTTTDETEQEGTDAPSEATEQMPQTADPAAGGQNGMPLPEGLDPSAMEDMELPEGFDSSMGGDRGGMQLPEGFDPSAMEDMELPEDFNSAGDSRGGFGGGMGAQGSSDVKLQYTDDDPASYSNIFDNAKTDITDADQTRLIEALKTLSSEDAASAVDIEAVIRYFVVHNFVCNDDSYTGSMVHNYYLYEKDGQLAMIPWDYNLAYGTFQGGTATSTINRPIDTPVTGSTQDDRPMLDWIFGNEEYTDLYHQYFSEFLQTVDITGIIDEAAALIADYVRNDATAFYSYEEFEAGVQTLRSFCQLRQQSVEGQLNGAIPTTTDGQNEDSSALIDASRLNLSDMGSMGGQMGGGMNGEMGGMQMPGAQQTPADAQTEQPANGETGTDLPTDQAQTQTPAMPEGETPAMPEGEIPTIPENGMSPPDGQTGNSPGSTPQKSPT